MESSKDDCEPWSPVLRWDVQDRDMGGNPSPLLVTLSLGCVLDIQTETLMRWQNAVVQSSEVISAHDIKLRTQ